MGKWKVTGDAKQRVNEQIRVSSGSASSPPTATSWESCPPTRQWSRLAWPTSTWSKWRPTNVRRCAESWITASSNAGGRNGDTAMVTRSGSRRSACRPRTGEHAHCRGRQGPANSWNTRTSDRRVMFRGRELAHIDEGRKVIDRSSSKWGSVQGRIASVAPRAANDLHPGAQIEGRHWDDSTRRHGGHAGRARISSVNL